MSRLTKLLAHIDAGKIGIEVAPYHSPALPKASYPKVLTLDVFDTATLKAHAAADTLIANEKIALIEDVDLIGDASSIGALVSEKGLAGKIAYIVSSHNFEHLPNPIRFLRGCGDVLEPGGVLSMAVPDVRACFDIFRMPTRLVDWLAAYHQDRSQPSPETIFDQAANSALHIKDGVVATGAAQDTASPAEFRLQSDLRTTYATYVQSLDHPGAYHDTHCTVMFPETLELMLRDLRYLGMINFEIIEVSQTEGIEFFVHLRKPLAEPSVIDAAEHLKVRQALAERIVSSLGSTALHGQHDRHPPHRFAGKTKRMIKTILGPERYASLSEANRKRRLKSKT